MSPQLHPEAAKSFEEKARVLLAAVAPEPRQVPSEPPTQIFRPGAPVVAHFSAEEIGGFKPTSKVDQLGRTTARYFEHEGRRFGFEDEKYQALARLSEGVQKTKAFRDLVSTKWAEDAILDWIKAKFAGEVVSALGNYLAERCEQDVREHEIWIPVSHLSVEGDLTFGNVVFRTITEELMDRWWELWQEATRGRGVEYAAKIEARFARERSELQGLVAATVKVTAEPKRALEVALRECEKAVATLRVYHIAATRFPEVTSYCALLGRENMEGFKHLEMEGGAVRAWGEQGVGNPVLHWHLSDNDSHLARPLLLPASEHDAANQVADLVAAGLAVLGELPHVSDSPPDSSRICLKAFPDNPTAFPSDAIHHYSCPSGSGTGSRTPPSKSSMPATVLLRGRGIVPVYRIR